MRRITPSDRLRHAIEPGNLSADGLGFIEGYDLKSRVRFLESRKYPMQTVVIVIHLLIVLALVGVVLMQRSEGGGLGSVAARVS